VILSHSLPRLERMRSNSTGSGLGLAQEGWRVGGRWERQGVLGCGRVEAGHFGGQCDTEPTSIAFVSFVGPASVHVQAFLPHDAGQLLMRSGAVIGVATEPYGYRAVDDKVCFSFFFRRIERPTPGDCSADQSALRFSFTIISLAIFSAKC